MPSTKSHINVFDQIFEQHPLPTVIFDGDGKIIHASKSFEEVIAGTRRPIESSFFSLFEKLSKSIAWPTLNQKTQWKSTFKTIDDRWLRLSITYLTAPNDQSFIAVIEDISSYLSTIERLEKQACTDYVTGLPNRNHLFFLVTKFLSSHPSSMLSVIVVDIDNYKRTTDRLNIHSANELLQSLVSRTKAVLKNIPHWASRDSADEFTIVIANHPYPESHALAQKLLRNLSRPLLIENQLFNLSFSAGISCTSNASKSSLNTLSNQAALALRQAKRQGKNRLESYNSSVKERSQTTKTIESSLPQAVSLEELELFLQPKISLKTQELCGFECLIRWFHPSLGEIAPDRFISLAEESCIINSLGFWVINEACNIGKKWLKDGGIPVPIAVNVSPKQLLNPTFAEHVEQILIKQEWPPHLLELEITESLLIDATDVALLQLKQLRRLGLRLSMDDFGTGYSSLASLRLLPIDVLKIDRQFILNLHKNIPADTQIISAIIGMAHSLNLQVVAEGIELDEQSEQLQKLGCDIGQGFLYSRPMPSTELHSWFTKYSRREGS